MAATQVLWCYCGAIFTRHQYYNNSILNIHACTRLMVRRMSAVICSKSCQNGGRCVHPNQCQCAKGYYGTDCEYKSGEPQLHAITICLWYINYYNILLASYHVAVECRCLRRFLFWPVVDAHRGNGPPGPITQHPTGPQILHETVLSYIFTNNVSSIHVYRWHVSSSSSLSIFTSYKVISEENNPVAKVSVIAERPGP